MSESFSSLDYCEQLVMRYRASGLTRKDFAEQAEISASALDYYVGRERKASLPADFAPKRIFPVELMPEEHPARPAAAGFSAGIAIRVAGDRMVEVERGFHADLCVKVLAALEADERGERA